ncbi:MAG: SGNH/GDSL hydrolase family protein [Bacteroidales bacterium]|nr:SGNH/GDSL hydrolase family protein [Bacteroidales bacterium]
MFFSLSLSGEAEGKKVLFIGDSITDGAWGNSKVWNTPSEDRNHEDMNHIYGHGYMMIAASQVQALYPEEQWKFYNRGISGNTLDDLSARWDKDVLALQPDVVSILVGTNDVEKHLEDGLPAKAWGEQYRTLLDRVLKQNPKVKFILCTPFVAKVGRIDNEDYCERECLIYELIHEIEAIAEEYPAVLIPFHSMIADTISKHPSTPVSYWIWDGIHPTSAMHYLMAQQWLATSYQFIHNK